MQIKLPPLGESIESGIVVSVSVTEGDSIQKGDTLLELETDKAVLDVPSPVSGKIETILVSRGESIRVDQPILSIIEATGQGEVDSKTGEPPSPQDIEARDEYENDSSERTNKPEREDQSPVSNDTTAQEKTEEERKTIGFDRTLSASPSVRNLAVEAGVDISKVQGTGNHGRITEADIKRAQGASDNDSQAPEMETGKISNGLESNETVRVQESTIRRITRENVERAWKEIPHVTAFDEARIDSVEDFRKSFASENGKVTLTPFLIKIVAIALKKFPVINTALDLETKEIIYKKFYNIGVAVETPAGLLIPVIRNADRKGILEIGQELGDLSARAQNRRLKPEEMEEGTFSISNLGALGGTGFTPIIRQPEAAILGVSRSKKNLILRNGSLEEEILLPLSLSYDHRIIDGADATRFLRWICEALQQPFLLEL